MEHGRRQLRQPAPRLQLQPALRRLSPLLGRELRPLLVCLLHLLLRLLRIARCRAWGILSKPSAGLGWPALLPLPTLLACLAARADALPRALLPHHAPHGADEQVGQRAVAGVGGVRVVVVEEVVGAVDARLHHVAVLSDDSQ